MALQNTGKENELQHEYVTEFSSSDYISGFTGVNNQFNRFSYTSLHHVFTNGLVNGASLLEVGCGPTIHCLISASRYFSNIVTSDFLESNRETVLKWLKNEPCAHDWSPVLKHVAALENEKDYHKLEERIRKNVTDVIQCDVLKPNPIAPLNQLFDVIVTSYCLESATTDVASYNKAVANVANLLNPGGTVIIVGELSGSFYYVGSKKFMVPILDKVAIHEALTSATLNVVYWSDESVHDKGDEHDATGMFVAVAKKLM